jgi:hypothetical protein
VSPRGFSKDWCPSLFFINLVIDVKYIYIIDFAYNSLLIHCGNQ